MQQSHSVLYWDDARYSSFPTVVKGDRDELWVGFNWNSHTPLVRGVHLRPSADYLLNDIGLL